MAAALGAAMAALALATFGSVADRLPAAARPWASYVVGGLLRPGVAVWLPLVALVRWLRPSSPELTAPWLGPLLLILGCALTFAFTWFMVRSGTGRARWRRIVVLGAWTIWMSQFYLADFQGGVFRSAPSAGPAYRQIRSSTIVAPERALDVPFPIPATTHLFWYGHELTGQVTFTVVGGDLCANGIPGRIHSRAYDDSVTRSHYVHIPLGARLLRQGMAPDQVARQVDYRLTLAHWIVDSTYHAHKAEGEEIARRLATAAADTEVVDLFRPIVFLARGPILTMRGLGRFPLLVARRPGEPGLGPPDSVVARSLRPYAADLASRLSRPGSWFVFEGAHPMEVTGQEAIDALEQIAALRDSLAGRPWRTEQPPRDVLPREVLRSIADAGR